MATLGPGGAERILSMLANRWVERGFDVTIVTLEKTDRDFYPLSSSVCRMTVPLATAGRKRTGRFALAIRLLRQAAALRRLVRTKNPDAVLSFIDSTNVMMLLSLIGTRFPRVVSERSDPAMVPLAAIWRILRAILYPSADRVVVQTEGAGRFFSGRVARRLAIIPNPVVRPDLDGEGEFKAPSPVIMSLGRFTEEKRFEDLLEAFAMIAPRHPEWSLLIAGDGPLRPALIQRAQALGLERRVLLPGLVEAPAHLLNRCDIYVLSSRFEGFPNALCEAMALGRPVIATDCPSGPRAIVRNGIDGILVPPMQPKALAKALDRLMSSPDECERLGAAAATIVDRFKLDPIIDTWEAVLLSAIQARH
jgi:GalNAc-alpha-(1->4)-GalNAc-alpha-(1->3)-diNAcBac-PP-undecaprenol alpha-1,4-N-acetyl-D-galactosaminyltransferase